MKANNYKYFDLKKLLIINYTLLIAFSSCSVSKQISRSAEKTLINDSVISTGHIGISIYEPATNKYWYNYDATKYFVPASNTKLFTLYAGMKYLGDSLVGIRYTENDTSITIQPTGDPTFLHDDFKSQPVFDFLKKEKRKIYITNYYWGESLGKGWAWDDYNDDYMVERNPFPIFGNVIKFTANHISNGRRFYISVHPSYFDKQNESFSFIMVNHFVSDLDITFQDTVPFLKIVRNRDNNQFELCKTQSILTQQTVPFCTNEIATTIGILNDDYNIKLIPITSVIVDKKNKIIHSQPIDSLFKPMMHNSDNFFAEQTLLMVSNEHLGYMKDEDIIDTLLSNDLKDIPQKPKWVDGSGLSRYNLFTPQDFVYILNKMKNEFGLKRLEEILPTGNEGTLKNYYLKDSSFIYAKTGSMSNNSSLSGFIITKKNKLLIFSVLVNNFQGSGTPVRKAIEKYLEGIREKY
jgi:D-alanyl-D-alanine carboxypeptidase/D-alanyl-D-alanine-endopeptidase (penicillin-binding protein 4)